MIGQASKEETYQNALRRKARIVSGKKKRTIVSGNPGEEDQGHIHWLGPYQIGEELGKGRCSKPQQEFISVVLMKVEMRNIH